MIVVDVETTGTWASKHGMVAIGAVEFEHPANQFYVECRIDADTEVDPQALAINGFSLAQIKDKKKPSIAEATKQFLDWTASVKDKTLAGHNTHFDAEFLRRATSRLKTSPTDRIWPFGYKYIDMHSIAYATLKRHRLEIPLKYDFSALTSPTVYEFVGLPNEPDPHNALTGAKMEAEAMHRLIYGTSLLPEFAKQPLPKYLKPAA